MKILYIDIDNHSEEEIAVLRKLHYSGMLGFSFSISLATMN